VVEYFDQKSRAKLDSHNDYGLLILDNHGSHVTMQFFDYYIKAFPPHSTHKLQPLDISLFRSLAINYSKYLDNWFIDRLAECRFTKREFFDVFRPAYAATFIEKNIISA
jgi:hypothetical protein